MRNTYCGVISIKLKNMIALLHSFSAQNCLIPDIPNSEEERNPMFFASGEPKACALRGGGVGVAEKGGV